MTDVCEERIAIRDMVRDFVRKEVAPFAAAWDRQGAVPQAKLFASRMCERVCSAAIQVHGGYGFLADYPVEKLYRDARVFQLYDGTNEVQKILIARELAAGR